MRRRRFPTPKSRGDLPGRAPAGAGKFPFVLEGSGARPASPGGQALRKCTLLAGKSLQPTPNFAKILPLSEPSLKLPTLGLQSLGRGRDGRGASLSRLLPPGPTSAPSRPGAATVRQGSSVLRAPPGLGPFPGPSSSEGSPAPLLSWRAPEAGMGFFRGVPFPGTPTERAQGGRAASYLKKSFLQ